MLHVLLVLLQSVKLLMNDFDNVNDHAAATAAVKPIYKGAHVFFTEGQFSSVV